MSCGEFRRWMGNGSSRWSTVRRRFAAASRCVKFMVAMLSATDTLDRNIPSIGPGTYRFFCNMFSVCQLKVSSSSSSSPSSSSSSIIPDLPPTKTTLHTTSWKQKSNANTKLWPPDDTKLRGAPNGGCFTLLPTTRTNKLLWLKTPLSDCCCGINKLKIKLSK